jgi:hypothetical protein
VRRALLEETDVDWASFEGDGLTQCEREGGAPGALNKVVGLLAR